MSTSSHSLGSFSAYPLGVNTKAMVACPKHDTGFLILASESSGSVRQAMAVDRWCCLGRS